MALVVCCVAFDSVLQNRLVFEAGFSLFSCGTGDVSTQKLDLTT